MKPIREWMGDKRVAGALAGVAILFVGYRLIGSGTGSAPSRSGGRRRAFAVGRRPGTGAGLRGSVAAAGVVGPPIPPGWTGPAWSWNRNPFLGPPRKFPGGSSREERKRRCRPGPLPEGPSPELRGTVVSGATAMAIFRSNRSNRLVPVGGKVGDWTLSRVEPYRVSLRRGKETRVLELYKQ